MHEKSLTELHAALDAKQCSAVELAQTFDAVDEGLKDVRTSSAKNTAGARIEIKTNKPVTSAVLLVSMLPRGEKEK